MKKIEENNSRREFIVGAGMLVLGATLKLNVSAGLPTFLEVKKEPIIDIHQHIHYHGMTDEQLLAHQRTMGISKTILLPAGPPINSASTYNGVANGLEVLAGGNAECYVFAKKHRKEFLFGVNAVPDTPDALHEIEKYLKLGAVTIGELKFGVECDSPEMQKIYQLAQAYDVPIRMHWQYNRFNLGFERFYKMLEKFPKVKFLGHAQTWWANIGKNYTDQSELYPKGPATPGGITDRYLSDYPNMYGDVSDGSCLNALTRDDDFIRGFFERHQDKLLYGSDCADTVGHGKACDGSQIIVQIRKLSSSKAIERKLLYENAKKMYHL